MICEGCGVSIQVSGGGTVRCPSCGYVHAPDAVVAPDDAPVIKVDVKEWLITSGGGTVYPYCGTKPELGAWVSIDIVGKPDKRIKAKKVVAA